MLKVWFLFYHYEDLQYNSHNLIFETTKLQNKKRFLIHNYTISWLHFIGWS